MNRAALLESVKVWGQALGIFALGLLALCLLGVLWQYGYALDLADAERAGASWADLCEAGRVHACKNAAVLQQWGLR